MASRRPPFSHRRRVHFLPLVAPVRAPRATRNPRPLLHCGRMDPHDQQQVRTRRGILLPWDELAFTAIRAGGPGGQNVNKTSTAIQLRFNIRGSASLTETQKKRLLSVDDQRLTTDGVLVIKAQQHRSQKKNRDDAVARLVDFIDAGLAPVKKRRRTLPGKAAVEKRLKQKSERSRVKALRRPPDES
jgi:ribosome-associated protein